MENKIDVAKILKDCPQGMKLDCTMFENLEFDHIEEEAKYSIICRIKMESGYNTQTFTNYGCYTNDKYSKCVIFPVGKTTWEGFHRPFVEGDIVYFRTKNDNEYITIFKSTEYDYLETYIDFVIITSRYSLDSSFSIDNIKEQRLATEEEKKKLFNAIKDNGYHWNTETKTLEKLINKNKFIVGATITNSKIISKIVSRDVDSYQLEDGNYVFFNEAHNWELVPDKFDITAFKPFDKVLVRDNNDCVWKADFYSHHEDNQHYSHVCTGDAYHQCIPFNKETAHLVGTTNTCPDKYKTWKDE